MTDTQPTTVTPGMLPTINDLAAGLAILLVYVTRFGTVTEGVAAPPYLTVTTDLLLPLLGALWLLVVPTYQVIQKVW